MYDSYRGSQGKGPAIECSNLKGKYFIFSNPCTSKPREIEKKCKYL